MSINQLDAPERSDLIALSAVGDLTRHKFIHEASFNLASLEKNKSADSHAGKIEWNTDIKTAFSRAQKEGKPLVVVFQEDRCGWCKLFANELEKPATAAIARDAVFLRVTPSSNAEGKQLAELCKIEGYPTVSVLTVKDGHITPVAKASGFAESEKFVENMRKVFADIDKKHSYS